MRRPPPRPRHRRRRRAPRVVAWSVAVLCVLAIAWAVVRAATSPSTPTAAPTTSAAAPGPGRTPLPVPLGSHAVGTTELSVVLPAPGSGPGQDLPVEVWYPAKGTRRGPVPDRAGGPFPLIAFSQGFDLSVQAYADLLADWASAGFVVAAPVYPHTDPGDPAGLDEEDILNHPADLRAAISGVVAATHSRGSTLADMVDAGRIGVAGHSDGGDVSLAVAANTCCRDPQVKAVAVLSGAELAGFGGTYFVPPTVPILVVQGSSDAVNAPACSAQIYDGAPLPKYYLDLPGAAHEPPYLDRGPVQQVVAETVAAFFEATLTGRHTGVPAMAAVGNVAGTAELTAGGTAPPAPGTCPGAPA